MILTLRTDNPQAETGLFVGGNQLAYYTWHADRALAKDLLKVVHGQLKAQHADWQDVTGVVVYQGPGSFTGLRIGLTMANTLAYAQKVPIVGTQGDGWIADGINRLQQGQNDTIVLPHYGAEANITMPKK